jgi:uncharacterized protein (TIGR02246 family)
MQNGLRILGGALLVAAIVAGCSKKETYATADSGNAMATAAPADRGADVAMIVGLDSAWLRNVMAKNVDSIMTFYTSDAVSYGFGSSPASGTDQLRALYTEFVKSSVTDPKLNSNTVNFSEDGMMAYDHGTYSMTVTPPGGKATKENGAYLNVWRKVDGQWKLVAEMSTPIAAPKS